MNNFIKRIREKLSPCQKEWIWFVFLWCGGLGAALFCGGLVKILMGIQR